MIDSGLFNFSDRSQVASLSMRMKKATVINSNITNAETPGYRALGYDFEEQLQTLLDGNKSPKVISNDPRHLKHAFVSADGQIRPDVYVRPSESVGHDGNTVDLDKEMAELAQNQILYRTAVETLNRKIGTLRYAINGGR